LQVNSSVIALMTEDERELLHFDYEREKKNNYPEAHLQVVASSEAWRSASPGRALERLHLPVGGRRYRFTLEDVAHFLLAEGLVGESEGAKDALAALRAKFESDQLRAAIRRDPKTAREFLATLPLESDDT